MTREEVIRIAGEVGAYRYENRYLKYEPTHTFTVEKLERFAQLVAAAEREACALVCDRKKKEFAEAFKDMADESLGAGQCAAAIRAVGSAA